MLNIRFNIRDLNGDMFDIDISYNYWHKLPLIPIGWHIYFIVKNLRLSFSDIAVVTQYDGWLVIIQLDWINRFLELVGTVLVGLWRIS